MANEYLSFLYDMNAWIYTYLMSFNHYTYDPHPCSARALVLSPSCFEHPFAIWYDRCFGVILYISAPSWDPPVVQGCWPSLLLLFDRDFWALSVVKAWKYFLFVFKMTCFMGLYWCFYARLQVYPRPRLISPSPFKDAKNRGSPR